MTSISDFIASASRSLDLDQGTAENATSGLLSALQKQVAQGDFQELLNQVPGAADLVQSPEGVGAGFGSLMGAAAGALGGDKVAGLTQLVSALSGSGLDADKAPSFLSMFFEFVKQKAGEQLASRLAGQIPGLKV
ncbi:MAG: DUF2780 domain-containing protein [Vulcanimicrobiota bacterium]